MCPTACFLELPPRTRPCGDELVEGNKLAAVISMPSGVFKPYSGVSTAVLVFTKTGAGGTDAVWFYEMSSDGFTLDDRREPTGISDIPDIITRFFNLEEERERRRDEKSFFVPKEEIAANGYDLTCARYKKAEYEAEALPPAEEIMRSLSALEAEIDAGLRELEGLL